MDNHFTIITNMVKNPTVGTIEPIFTSTLCDFEHISVLYRR